MWIIITASIIIGLGIVFIYNKIIKNKNLVDEAWSNIDVQLKRRYNLLPNLVNAVSGYMTHEKKLLTEITQLRNSCAKLEQEKAKTELFDQENILSLNLKQFWALIENYPDLKANDTFLQLQIQLADIEDQLQFARRYYNGAVRDLNIIIESFPSNFIAKAFGFTIQEFFQIENPMEKLAPKVNLDPKDE